MRPPRNKQEELQKVAMSMTMHGKIQLDFRTAPEDPKVLGPERAPRGPEAIIPKGHEEAARTRGAKEAQSQTAGIEKWPPEGPKRSR